MVYLDLASGLLVASPSDASVVSLLQLTLGEAALDVRIVGGLIQPLIEDDALVAPGVLQLSVKKLTAAGTADYDTEAVVTGGVNVSETATSPQVLNLGENWRSVALRALFAEDQVYANLRAQYRWRNGEDAAGVWHYSSLLSTRVRNSLFLPAAADVATLTYKPSIDAYIGSETALEALPGSEFANGSKIVVDIDQGGGVFVESSWRVIKPATAVTDLDAGTILLLDGTAHLLRVGGL